MIFSTKNVEKINNKKLPASSILETTEESFSFFENTLANILIEQREFEFTMIGIEEGILSLKNSKEDKSKSIDIKTILSKILDWFIDSIGKLEETFIVFLTKFLNFDKRIKLYKEKIANFEGEVKLNRKYFDYSHLLSDDNFTSFSVEITKEYDNLIRDLSGLNKFNKVSDIVKALEDIKSDSAYNSDDINIMRGKIVGKNSTISSDEFGRELFKYFRSGKEEGKSGEIIKTEEIKKTFDSYFNHLVQQRVVKRESSKLKRIAENQKLKLRTTNLFSYVPHEIPINSEMLITYNSIITTKCRKIRDICTIFTMYYSAKLDALKEFNLKNKSILSNVTDQIIKTEARNKKYDKRYN